MPTVATGNISYDNTGSVYAVTEDVVYGDVNSDSKIDLLDMILLKSYVTDESTEGFSVKSADLDGDGKISAKDVVELSMYLINQTGSFSYEMNVDTDGDGLCDYVEKEMLKTDYLKKDTDGDGLNDYAEVYLCNTDPLSADTGKSGISDSLKDADGDKLTNAEEIKYGTSPSAIDTDEDGLDDYTEVSKYKTDPLKCDTDGDGISDNGEIILGLDPLKSMTDTKIADAERIFEQELSWDDKLLKTINGEDSPYSLSVSVKAAGYISESINIDVSLYSNYLQNDSVEGDIVDIDYNDDLKFESMTINFDVSENAEKYFIFRYFDDIGMLVPVDTQYDGNRVYTVSAEDGTYCIVDIEKWMSNNAETAKFYDNTQESVKSSEVSESLEVYFLMYVYKSLADGARNSVAKASRAIIDYCNKQGRDVKIYYASYIGSTVVSKETQNNYVSNTSTDEEITEMLSRSGAAQGSLDTTDFNFSLTRALKKSLLEVSGVNENSKKYCFIVDINFEPVCASNIAVVDEMKSYGVDFSFICNDTNDNIVNYEILSSDGKYYSWNPDFSGIVIDKVIDGETDVISYNYETGLFGNVSFKCQITYDWYKAANGKYTDEEIKKLGLPDSDNDGKYDFEEISWDYVTIENGEVVLPTFAEICNKNIASASGIVQFMQVCKAKGVSIDFSATKVLVLKSNPLLIDSDFDGIDDIIDDTPSRESATEIDSNILDDSNIFDYSEQNNIEIKENGKFEYVNIEGSNSVKKPTVTYTRFANSDKRTVSKFRILYCNKPSDFKITIDSVYDNDFEMHILNTIDAVKSKEYEVVKDENNNITTFVFSTLNDESEEEYTASSPSWEYFIELYITPDENIPVGKNKYTIKFEQDNWIYAPNGGVALNRKENYAGVYLKDDALRVLMEDTREQWEANKDKLNSFPTSLASNIARVFYDGNKEKKYLYMAQGGEYEIASDVSTVVTYTGFVLEFVPNNSVTSVVSELCTIVGAITTYKANYPVGRLDFQKSITNLVDELLKYDTKDMSMVLYRYDKAIKDHEQFECEKWRGDYIYRYKTLDNLLFNRKNVLRLSFENL